MSADVNIIDAEGRSRFEARLDGTLAGFLEYRRDDDAVDYLHTFVSRTFRERGVGSALAQGALDDARHRGLKVKVSCGFVQGWVIRHPDYQELVV